MKDIAVRGVFNVDVLEYSGYRYTDIASTWNGFICPYFEHQEMLKMVSEIEWLHYAPLEGYVYYDNNGEQVIILNEIIDTEHGEQMVYAIGNGSWTWMLKD